MSQRSGGDEPVKDSAALQELAAGVVHGVYRVVKACQFHADVANDAVTSLTASAVQRGRRLLHAAQGPRRVALSFLGDAIFVNRQILKASRDTHALAVELRDLLETCEVTELTLARTVDRTAISSFAKLLADVQRDRSLVVAAHRRRDRRDHRRKSAVCRVAARRARSRRGSARRAPTRRRCSPCRACSRTCGSGKFELPRRIKRVAQQVVARADEDARLLVALAATGGVSLDAATIAVGQRNPRGGDDAAAHHRSRRARERGDDRAALRRGAGGPRQGRSRGTAAHPQRRRARSRADAHGAGAHRARSHACAGARAHGAPLRGVVDAARASTRGSLQGSPAADAARLGSSASRARSRSCVRRARAAVSASTTRCRCSAIARPTAPSARS